MTHEIDHVFILSAVEGPEARELIELGLTEGEPNRHPGQGTANRRFFFENAMLELLWVQDRNEVVQEPAARTALWPRWRDRRAGASPFGICLRPAGKKPVAPPFPVWSYVPDYLPEGMQILMGEESRHIERPLIFCVTPPASPRESVSRATATHPAGLRELTRVRLTSPGSPSESNELRALERLGVEFCVEETHLLELGFDHEPAGEQHDLRPALPLRLSW